MTGNIKFSLKLFFFFLLPLNIIGQEKGEKLTRHQIGLNMGEFIPIFKTQPTNYDLNYNFSLNSTYRLRSAINYDEINDDVDGKIDLGIKIGADRIIKKIGRFHAYGGMEMMYGLERFQIDNRTTEKWGANAFLGIRFAATKHFSISTEPGFYQFFVKFSDPKSFQQKESAWQERGIKNIGHLLMSIHF